MPEYKKCSACKQDSLKFYLNLECGNRICNKCTSILIYRNIRHWYKTVEKGYNVECVYFMLAGRDIKFNCGFCKRHNIVVDMSDKMDLLRFTFQKLDNNILDRDGCISMILTVLNNY